ncbi:MAG TPA: hypothetical protein VHB97_02565, partial [Polyangia bacterium]|nr:hypothetical protein [Polyangia bacterium]
MLNKAGLVVLLLLTSAFDTPVAPPIAARGGGGASTGAAPTPAPLASTCHLNYYGGHVLENVVVVEVNWGAGVNATVQSSIGGFYAAVTGSAYFDWLSEYNTVGLNGFSDGLPGSNQGISHGSFGGSYTITPSNTSTSLTDAQVAAELVAQLTAGKLPAPATSADGDLDMLYMIEFPYGYAITLGASKSCAAGGFCAYHSTTTYNGKSLAYGVLPDMMNPSSGCYTGCGADPTQFNNVTSVHSHELVESVTDTEIGLTNTVQRPIAWYSTTHGCGEIGDICNAQQGTVAGYTVQKEWSNAAGACIVSKATLPPICTGPSTPAGCRVCTAADNGIACNGATPYCETTTTNVKYGTCVACVSNAQCSGATPFCGKSATATSDDICRACTASDCSGAKGACETTGTFAGQCVQCTAANATACTGAGNQCDTTIDQCVQCVSDGDCIAADACHSAACNQTSHTCVQTALTGTACSDGNACTIGDMCQAGVCSAGMAKTCPAIDQCHSAGTCNSVDGTCSMPAVVDGTTCSDGDACTTGDSCQSGVCTGGAPPTCAAGDECNDPATCSMATGCGAVTPKADGTACSIGSCQSGVCTAAPPADMTMPADM